MPKRPTNNRTARGISTSKANRASWDALDALPAPVRRALWEAPVSINPASAADLIDYGGVGYAVRELREACLAEIGQFAQDHRIQHGYSLPHVAADATVQRY